MDIKPAIGSEKMVIGALLLDASFYESVQKSLSPDDFSDERLKEIFIAMNEIYIKRETFDIIMIADELRIENEILIELANECYSIKNIMSHCDIIREKSIQRKLMECARQIKEIKDREAK